MAGSEAIGAGRTVLVAVTDVFFYTKLKDALKPSGIRIEKARTAGEVLEKAGAGPPDAVVLDINDPAVDAFQVLTALTADPRTTAIPILAFANHEDIDSWHRARQLGVTKIVSRNEFSSRTLALVQAVLTPRGEEPRPGVAGAGG